MTAPDTPSAAAEAREAIARRLHEWYGLKRTWERLDEWVRKGWLNRASELLALATPAVGAGREELRAQLKFALLRELDKTLEACGRDLDIDETLDVVLSVLARCGEQPATEGECLNCCYPAPGRQCPDGRHVVGESTPSAAEGEEARDAARYRFLRDNPLGLRAVDGNARLTGSLDWHVDTAMEHTASTTPKAGVVETILALRSPASPAGTAGEEGDDALA